MNDQTKREETPQTALLKDLPLTTEQADDTKAGAISGSGGHGAGKVALHDIGI